MVDEDLQRAQMQPPTPPNSTRAMIAMAPKVGMAGPRPGDPPTLCGCQAEEGSLMGSDSFARTTAAALGMHSDLIWGWDPGDWNLSLLLYH